MGLNPTILRQAAWPSRRPWPFDFIAAPSRHPYRASGLVLGSTPVTRPSKPLEIRPAVETARLVCDLSGRMPMMDDPIPRFEVGNIKLDRDDPIGIAKE